MPKSFGSLLNVRPKTLESGYNPNQLELGEDVWPKCLGPRRVARSKGHEFAPLPLLNNLALACPSKPKKFIIQIIILIILKIRKFIIQKIVFLILIILKLKRFIILIIILNLPKFKWVWLQHHIQELWAYLKCQLQEFLV